MSKIHKLNRAKKILFILEFLEAIESSFIIGLSFYLTTVIKISYMTNIIYYIIIISFIFLFTAVKGIYRNYQNYTINIV